LREGGSLSLNRLHGNRGRGDSVETVKAPDSGIPCTKYTDEIVTTLQSTCVIKPKPHNPGGWFYELQSKQSPKVMAGLLCKAVQVSQVIDNPCDFSGDSIDSIDDVTVRLPYSSTAVELCGAALEFNRARKRTPIFSRSYDNFREEEASMLPL
jgi:hypothetical protein